MSSDPERETGAMEPEPSSELKQQDWDAIENGNTALDDVAKTGDFRDKNTDVGLPAEDDDTPHRGSDEAIPEDMEERAISLDPSKEESVSKRFGQVACYSVGLILAGTMLLSAEAIAQQDEKLPPENGVKLSEIVAKVEQRDGFRYLDEIEWDETGYTVIYHTTDKAKVEIVFDPVTGQPK